MKTNKQLKTETISFKTTDKILNKIDIMAKKKKWSRSQVVSELVIERLEQIEKDGMK